MSKNTRSNRAAVSPRDIVRRALKEQPVGACFDDVKKVARALYKGINTPLASELLHALNAGDIDTIANANVDPRSYTDPETYFLDVSAASFLKKFEKLAELGKSKTLNPRKAAVDNFFRAEAQCLQANERLGAYADGRLLPTDLDVARVISRAQDLIMSILPKVPALKDIVPRFGPGATSACKGESVTIADKLLAFPEITYDGLRFVNVMKNSPAWFNLATTVHPGCLYRPRRFMDDFGNEVIHVPSAVIAPKVVRGNRFTTVPKNAKTDRGICIEPHTLSCVQLFVGSMLADVLASLGIQKDITAKVHGGFAQQASRDGKLCTVDLSNASDTVCWQLVQLLLPWDWFCFLARLRSPETYIEGKWVKLEKFSSMGNGFTFELETLIFYALARSVSDVVLGENVAPASSFGDDIIVSSACYPLLRVTLEFCGFTINRDKTFVGCGFNESCGQDFFDGVDVRPYFLKGDLTHVTDWYSLVNGIHRMGQKHSCNSGVSSRFLPAYLRAISSIPKSLRLHGPLTDHDAWIHSEDRKRWTRRDSSGQLRMKFTKSDFTPEWVIVPRNDQIDHYLGIVPEPVVRSLERYCSTTQYASLLYGCESTGFALRGEPASFKPVWLVATSLADRTAFD